MGIIYTCITCDKTEIHGWEGYQCSPCQIKRVLLEDPLPDLHMETCLQIECGFCGEKETEDLRSEAGAAIEFRRQGWAEVQTTDVVGTSCRGCVAALRKEGVLETVDGKKVNK